MDSITLWPRNGEAVCQAIELGEIAHLETASEELTESAIQVHDVALCRPLLEQTPVLRAGDLLLEDGGFLDGAMLSELKRQRKVDVIMPLKANMLGGISKSLRL
jgi:hypothetical protein